MGELNMRECPFCGCDAWIIEDRGDNGSEPLLYRPQCKMCGGGLGGFQFRDNAITAWNTRPRTEGRGDQKPRVDDLAMLVRMLVQHVPETQQIHGRALDYLARHGLSGSPLRASPIREPEISRTSLIAALDVKLAEVGGAFLSNDQAADAILNLAPVGGRAEGWRPIETAPKDGTTVLLFCPQGDGSPGATFRVTAGHWCSDPGGTTEYRDAQGRYIGQDDRDGFEGWLSWDGGFSEDTMMPTMWQPLPLPPQDQGGMK